MSLISVTLPNPEDLIWHAGYDKGDADVDDDYYVVDDDGGVGGKAGEHFGGKRKESTFW